MKMDQGPQISLRVNILKVGEDSDKHCVEVIKEFGDRFDFDEIFKNIREFFGGYANAKE
jgi:hypothetical protein